MKTKSAEETETVKGVFKVQAYFWPNIFNVFYAIQEDYYKENRKNSRPLRPYPPPPALMARPLRKIFFAASLSIYQYLNERKIA